MTPSCDFRRTKRALLAAAAATFLLVGLPGPALAAECSSVNGYAGSGGNIQVDLDGCGAGGGDVAGQTVSSGGAPAGRIAAAAPQASPAQVREVPSTLTLPFTGFDMQMLAAGGLLLFGIGLSLRRATRLSARA